MIKFVLKSLSIPFFIIIQILNTAFSGFIKVMLTKPLSIPGVLNYYYINFFSRLNYIVFTSSTQCRNHNGKFCAMDHTSENRWLSHLGLKQNLWIFIYSVPSDQWKNIGLFSLKCACVLPLNITGRYTSINKIVLWTPQRIAWGEETNEITMEGAWNNKKYVPDPSAVADSVKCMGVLSLLHEG